MYVKISPSDIPPAISRTDRTSNPSVPSSQSGTHENIEGVVTAHSTSDTYATRLISLLSQRGIAVSTEQAYAIEAELIKLGIQFSDVDSDVAFRALLLYRSNIPLSPELLRDAFRRGV
jgi:hypothetical protein